MTRGRAAIRLLGLALLLGGCARSGTSHRQSPADSAAAVAFSPSINAFGCELYRALAETPGNIAISPLSVSSCLGMACVGAAGPTREEMERALQVSGDFATGYRVLRERFTAQPGDTLAVVNRIWIQRGEDIRGNYRRTLERDFAASAGKLDFGRDPESARATMNRWFSEQTGGRVGELFPAGSIDAGTYAVLGNAVRFVGKWQDPFEPGDTLPGPFHPNPDSTITVPMMHQSGELAFARIPDARMIQLNYQGSLSFLVILPDSLDGLAALERMLTADSLAAWCARLSRHEVQLAMPKFDAKSAHLLTPELEALGMEAAFSKEADFSGISSRKPLFLDVVAHQAWVHVDEEGTVAVAATATVTTTATIVLERIETVTVDHPFLFAIRDRATGCLLFLGRCVTPA
jgi:serpin B